jgi:hypothetical protein
MSRLDHPFTTDAHAVAGGTAPLMRGDIQGPAADNRTHGRNVPGGYFIAFELII